MPILVCSLQHIHREHHAGDSNTSKPPYLLVESKFIIFVLQKTLTSWEAEGKNVKTSLPDWIKKQELMGWTSAQKKSKALVNSAHKNTNIHVMMNGQKIEEEHSFTYLGSTLSKDGTPTKETKLRITVAMFAMPRLNNIWKSRWSSFKIMLKLYRIPDVSILLYGCESWRDAYKHFKRNASGDSSAFRTFNTRQRLCETTNGFLAGKQRPLLPTVKRHKFFWFGHIIRNHTIAKTIPQGTMEVRRRRGCLRKT